MPRKSASKKQRGGSLASDRVMKNLDTAAATHDHVVSPRIRTNSKLGNTETYKLTGGACGACGGHKHAEGFRGCGATAPTQSGGARRRTNKSGKSSSKNRKTSRKSSGKNRKTSRKSSGKNRKTRKTRKQRGGQGNDMNPKKMLDTYGPEVVGIVYPMYLDKRKEHSELELGDFLREQFKGREPSFIQEVLPKYKKERSKNKELSFSDFLDKYSNNQTGGGSAWMASQYSQSLARASQARSSQFSRYAPASRNTLLNPPNMGLAGSGFGGTFDTNAPANLK
jgi:hypothetical protein